MDASGPVLQCEPPLMARSRPRAMSAFWSLSGQIRHSVRNYEYVSLVSLGCFSLRERTLRQCVPKAALMRSFQFQLTTIDVCVSTCAGSGLITRRCWRKGIDVATPPLLSAHRQGTVLTKSDRRERVSSCRHRRPELHGTRDERQMQWRHGLSLNKLGLYRTGERRRAEVKVQAVDSTDRGPGAPTDCILTTGRYDFRAVSSANPSRRARLRWGTQEA